MTEKQEELLKLFLEVDEVCKKHNLRYVMAGGTLLGVVRHKGFIPWDDDVDIYMPRSDWYKLVELSKTEFPPNRTVQCLETDREFTNTFPRYGSTDTCAIHRHQIIGNDKAGEIIDVLTLDPIPADDKEYEKYRTHMMIYSDLVNVSAVFGNRWEIPVGLYFKYLMSCLFLGRDKTLKKLEKIMFSYEEEECDRYAMRWGGCPFLFSKEMMFPVKYMEFENNQVMVPQHVSDYLIWHYGDEWTYIPPHGERESHDTVSVEGMNYEEFRKEYMPDIKKGKLRFDAVMRKLYYLANAKRSHKLMRKRQELLAKSIEMDLKARIKECGNSLEELLEKRKYNKLTNIFSEYFRVQLSADFIGREDFVNIYSFYHPVLISVEDSVFYAAMMTLLYTERVAKADRMLQVRKKLDHITPEMEKLEADIVLFRKAADRYEFKEIEETEKIINELLERYPDNISFLKFKIRLIMEKARETKKPWEAEEFTEKCLKLFPEDGYFLKYKGEVLWMKGRCRDALELFADAREKTNNGITHLEIDEFLEEYKIAAMDTIKELLNGGRKEEAWELLTLWMRLLPNDETIKQYAGFIEIEMAGTQDELEEVIKGISARLKSYKSDRGKMADEKDIAKYQEAIARAWERLGYPKDLAKIRVEIGDTEESEDLELLAQRIRNDYIILEKNKCAQAYKLLGDIRMKQGHTAKAFEFYIQAADYAKHSYVKKELARIILQDLSKGSTKAVVYARRADGMEFMNHWLDKYGSIEDIQRLVNAII